MGGGNRQEKEEKLLDTVINRLFTDLGVVRTAGCYLPGYPYNVHRLKALPVIRRPQRSM